MPGFPSTPARRLLHQPGCAPSLSPAYQLLPLFLVFFHSFLSPVFLRFTPPAPHPLVGSVRIEVQSLEESLWSRLLRFPDLLHLPFNMIDCEYNFILPADFHTWIYFICSSLTVLRFFFFCICIP